jgi:alcohol dehydrogenase
MVGTGPIGLSPIMGARMYSPSHVVVDQADSRLEAAKAFGADIGVHSGREDAWRLLKSSLAASALM